MELILLAFAFGGVTAVVSKNKGESAILGFLMGLCLGPLGLLLAFVTGGTVCGRCKKNVHPKATKCPYCQTTLKKETDGEIQEERVIKTDNKLEKGLIIGIVALGVFALICVLRAIPSILQ